MSTLETKSIKQKVINNTVQPLYIGGIQTDNSDAVAIVNNSTFEITKLSTEQSMTLALSDETTPITVGNTKLAFRSPYDIVLTKTPKASLTNASTSGNPTIDINKNGSSIFSTTLSIDANEKTSVTAATAAVLSTTSIADDDELTFDIDTAGTGAKGLKVTLYYKRT